MKMLLKRVAFVPYLLASSLIFCVAQSATPQQSEADATVVSFEWKYAGYQRAETTKGYDSAKSKDGSYKIARATVYVFKYMAKAVLKNTGAKAIKEVSWDYVFTNPESGKEVRRFKIQSRQQISPGASETLAKDISIAPGEDTRPLNTARQSVQVTRIEYADGSTWRRQ